MPVDGARDLFLARYSDQTLSLLPGLEQNQSRNTTNPITIGDGWIVVDIQLDDTRTLRVFRRHGIHGRRKDAARPAPLSPEVDQHRHFRLQNNFLKILVVYCLDVLT